MLAALVGYAYRIGADENGLGARLGPLVVTAVLARVDAGGERLLKRRLPRKIRADLADSKQLVSHGDVALGEAWARVLAGDDAGSPARLFERLSLESGTELRHPCPEHVAEQCWSPSQESFSAPAELVQRLGGHRAELARRGVEIVRACSSVVCTRRLNDKKSLGQNRFIADLHSMERLVLELRREAGQDVMAVCGKVGGMGDYSRFFGPLGGWLHAVMEQGRARSAYRFPGLGELHFVRDADGCDPLVMLASLVGKWVRELLMSRVSRYYTPDAEPDQQPSGYHDPLTARFVEATSLVRSRRRIPDVCFERAGARDE